MCEADGAPPLPLFPGAAAALHSRLDGSFHVAQRQRPRQLLHPLPDRSGGPAGNRPAGAQLLLPVAHRGPRQRRGGLSGSREGGGRLPWGSDRRRRFASDDAELSSALFSN